MAVCYYQPAYCLQTGNGRLSACAKLIYLPATLRPSLDILCIITWTKIHPISSGITIGVTFKLI